jgi:alpha-N-acetylglucosaminidase
VCCFAQDPLTAKQKAGAAMVGIGLTPEAIENNFPLYDMMMEWVWRGDFINVTNWVSEYAIRRYGVVSGKAAAAWSIFQTTVFDCRTNQHGTTASLFAARPQLAPITRVSHSDTAVLFYAPEKLVPAWKLLIDAADEVETKRPSSSLRLDLVEVGRQVMSNLFQISFAQVLKAGVMGDRTTFNRVAATMTTMLDDVIELLLSFCCSTGVVLICECTCVSWNHC